MASQRANEDYAALLGRLRTLERDNRRMKRIGALVPSRYGRAHPDGSG